MSLDSMFPNHELITTASATAGFTYGILEGIGKKVETYKPLVAIPAVCGFVHYGGIGHGILGAGIGGALGIAFGAWMDSSGPMHHNHEGKIKGGLLGAATGATIGALGPGIEALLYGGAPALLCYYGARFFLSKVSKPQK